MDTLATTRMSSKGQIVIPEAIRKRMNLQPGMHFVVVAKEDVVILKAIPAPGMEEFDALINDARRQAREAGLKRVDIENAIAEARGKA